MSTERKDNGPPEGAIQSAENHENSNDVKSYGAPSQGSLLWAAQGGGRGPLLLLLEQLGNDARSRIARVLGAYPAEVDATLQVALRAIEDELSSTSACDAVADRARGVATRVALVALSVATVKARVLTAEHKAHRRSPANRSSRLKPLAKVRDLRALTVEAMTGSGDAMARLLPKLHQLVRSTVAGVLRNPHDVEDVTQLAMLRILTHLPALAVAPNPEAWVKRVARNEALRHLERQNRRRDVEAAAGLERFLAPQPDLDDDETFAIVWSALQQLGARHRDVLILRHLKELRPPAIAKLLNIPEPTVRSRLTIAKRRLCELLGVPFRSSRKNESRGGARGR